MKYKYIGLVMTISLVIFCSSYTTKTIAKTDTIKISHSIQDSIIQDSVQDSVREYEGKKLKLYKKHAHASYLADKFNGRRTASGAIFNNNKYTAAHKKLPFGTKLKVTNEANKKSVVVVVNDRGPFTKGREIDLTKKAFFEISRTKHHGSVKVTIEIIQ
ncbi:septal ring lytic transglycosylase RlpA family protein [Flavobacterium sp. '19STA2R22 D10 B1']|uniref:septal ring lytic transglycosylase RlpA family protein n=1 Tax=Flavobacterium aerium TaxID=3037261 RepID=UPI00278C5E38|nr:septal ring lytic transglycosylase RlpA family protein [Flavobacterium sp. '19STA2R22 D10 B1']